MLPGTLTSAEVDGRLVQLPRVTDVSNNIVAPGEMLEFTLDLARLHVFDAQSGRSPRS
ncbi:MAG: hypothetical protein ACYC3K_16975 [Candidatus Nanopelagicales bacterium]